MKWHKKVKRNNMQMINELCIYVFQFMDWLDMSIFAMVSKKTRQFIIIENNERWKHICFHGVYDISFNYFCVKSTNCMYCLLCNMIGFEEIIDNIVETKNEYFTSHYCLFVNVMKHLLTKYKNTTCTCEKKHNLLEICGSPKCECYGKHVALLSKWFPQMNGASKYNTSSIIKYIAQHNANNNISSLCTTCIKLITTNNIYICKNCNKQVTACGDTCTALCYGKCHHCDTELLDICKICRKKNIRCDWCEVHYNKSEIKWIDECFIYECHLNIDSGPCAHSDIPMCESCITKSGIYTRYKH